MEQFNRCVDCRKHIMVSNDPTEGKCMDKAGYTTLNALKKLYCPEFVSNVETETNIGLNFKIFAILANTIALLIALIVFIYAMCF